MIKHALNPLVAIQWSAKTCLWSRNYVRSVHDIRISNSLIATPITSLEFLIDSSKDDQSPRVLQWYSCGPTVYDDAHLGHARTYVCTDVIRRVLQDYFKVSVNFALGITDVDDKIIARAKETGLGSTWQQMTSYARPFELRFFADMDALNIRRPNAVLRVSEHMSEIEAYVQRLRASGAAYDVPHEGVYFDCARIKSTYGKLGGLPGQSNPGSEHSSPSTDEEPLVGKRFFRDFALWKRAKPGEPSYPSNTLGAGRPGWHIECSAMTHSYFGASFDVHSGGIDLRFPHHTNEIAQAEAHAQAVQGGDTAAQEWVRIWLHTGHLHIQGLKMSKSLKNFISVRQFLSNSQSPYPAVDFRLFCLQHHYSSTLNFSESRIHEAGAYRDRLTGLLDLAAVVERAKISAVKATSESVALTDALLNCQRLLRKQFADDFNTPAALSSISVLVGQAIAYGQAMLSQGTQSPQPSEPLLNVAQWVSDTFVMLGVHIPTVGSNPSNNADKRRGDSTSKIDADRLEGSPTSQREMNALVQFRSKVRVAALNAVKAKGLDHVAVSTRAAKDILTICDTFRDIEAPRLGYVVRDVGEVSTFSRAESVKDQKE